MPLIDKDSFVWTDTGVAPTPGNETASPGEQPIAEYFNHVMWAITDDIDDLNNAAGAHAARHQNGGGDEINLNGLSVGAGGSLTSAAADLLSLSTPAGSEVATLNTATQRWTKFPPINPLLTLYGGLNVAGGDANISGNLTDGATVIYDGVANELTEAVMPSGYATGDYVERGNPSVTASIDMNGNYVTDLGQIHFRGTTGQVINYESADGPLTIRDRSAGVNALEVQQNSIVSRRDHDMNGNQIRHFRVENRTSDPTNPATGRFWVRTDL